MRILLFGTTGMIGQGVLRECVLDKRVTEILSVGRSSVGRHDSKLSEVVLPDLAGIAQIEEQLSGFDACFFCLGVTSVGMSAADYTRLTHALTIAIATVLAPRNSGMTFIYVTGAGTSRDSRQMWARVKARTEDGLASMPFKAAYFFRPGFVQPLHGVVSKTRWYMAIYAVIRPLSSLLALRFPGVATTTERLGRAMINVAANGFATPVLESRAINTVGLADDQC